MSTTPRVRCAIYTRKSSDEGLEQAFNSLDAQREACAAYILSQASEGWIALPDIYDDGGISGGTLERPALRRLLSEVIAGRVDTIVVYKVDRLTRSLIDFSKLVEAFDKAGTSFVSVTQSFNTTTSMGRLTLNMLLSFAQFEREVTAERIRDKIAASKAKGMWMGGTPPLGYKPDGRSLKVIDDHAAIVQDIFARYLALGNVRHVAEALERDSVRTPVRTKMKTGATFGGVPLGRGQIYTILRNPLYVGEVHHGGNIYPGLHNAIIDRDTWRAVQAVLAEHRQGHRRGDRASSPGLLAGLIVDDAGEPLISTHACKGITRYRYYVSRALHHGAATAGIRIPAREIETVVTRNIAALFDDPIELIARASLLVDPHQMATLFERAGTVRQQASDRNHALLRDLVARVRVCDHAIEINLHTAIIASLVGTEVDPDASTTVIITSAMRLTRNGRAMRLVQGGGTPLVNSRVDAALVKLLVKARHWWATLREGEMDVSDLAAREGVGASYVTRVVRLAFLAPQVIEAILAGQQGPGATVHALTLGAGVDPRWREQVLQLLAH